MNIQNNIKEIKNNFLKKENFLFLTFTVIIFILDRVTKLKIINSFNGNSYYINDFINLELIWNTGIGFGLLSSNSTLVYNFITVFIGIIILLMLAALVVSKYLIEKIIFSIIIGGACGNIYDRLIYKAVPDFIDLHYQNFHWFVFNIADIFISLGIILFLIRGFIVKE